jgi:hypothetical protein
MVLMHRMQDKTNVIEHVARGRWAALEREEKLRSLTFTDNQLYQN